MIGILRYSLVFMLFIGTQGLAWGQQESSRTISDARSRARIHAELGAAYFQAGNPAVALEELEIALASDSSYFPAYSIRGLVRASLKENAKAEEDFQKAIALAPKDPEVNNNYGWYLCETGKPRQSIAFFLEALKTSSAKHVSSQKETNGDHHHLLGSHHGAKDSQGTTGACDQGTEIGNRFVF